MPFSVSNLWQRQFATWVTLPLVSQGNNLVVRIGSALHALDADSGQDRWRVEVDPDGGSGHLIHGSAGLCITDRRPDPLHLTQLVLVRDGTIVKTIDLGCIVEENASVVASGLLYAVGNDPERGPVLRAVDLESGSRKIDVPLSRGADSLARQGDRLLVLNRMASPGLYWISPEGQPLGDLEETSVQEVRISGGRTLSALRTGNFPQRTIQARDLAANRILWTAPGHGAVIGLDGDAAVYCTPVDGQPVPVLCDPITGKERWRAEPVAKPAEIFFAGPWVFVGHMTGLRAYRREDGAPAGEVEDGSQAQSLGSRLFLGGFRFLSCVDLEA